MNDEERLEEWLASRPALRFEVERQRKHYDFAMLLIPYVASGVLGDSSIVDFPAYISDEDDARLDEILGDQTWADFVLEILPEGSFKLHDLDGGADPPGPAEPAH